MKDQRETNYTSAGFIDMCLFVVYQGWATVADLFPSPWKEIGASFFYPLILLKWPHGFDWWKKSPSHVFSEDDYSNKKQRERNVCVVCIRDFVETENTNAIRQPVVPIHLCRRQQSSLKPPIPYGETSFDVPWSPFSASLELMSVSVFVFLETMSNRIGLVIKEWQILSKKKSLLE